ncbi:hypothetical protein MASR1M65_23220 [Saprospiraceae bacterium]
MTEYVEDNELDLIVVFKDKADVSVAKYLSTKSAKGRYVYEALKATTQSSQKNVMAWAAYHHYKTKSFYITNALQIKIPAASLEQLASFVEVKYISNNGLLRYHEPVEKYPALLRGNEGKEWGMTPSMPMMYGHLATQARCCGRRRRHRLRLETSGHTTKIPWLGRNHS